MSNLITEWEQQRFLAEIMDRLEARMDIVGKVVEDDARQRLLAIREPVKREKYRRLIVARQLTHIVERTDKGVIVWIGIRTGPKGRDYGLWIELGTSGTLKNGKKLEKYPAHPFIRPAVFNNAREIVRMIEGT